MSDTAPATAQRECKALTVKAQWGFAPVLVSVPYTYKCMCTELFPRLLSQLISLL